MCKLQRQRSSRTRERCECVVRGWFLPRAMRGSYHENLEKRCKIKRTHPATCLPSFTSSHSPTCMPSFTSPHSSMCRPSPTRPPHYPTSERVSLFVQQCRHRRSIARLAPGLRMCVCRVARGRVFQGDGTPLLPRITFFFFP